jgi:hypothetical protein
MLAFAVKPSKLAEFAGINVPRAALSSRADPQAETEVIAPGTIAHLLRDRRPGELEEPRL